MGLHFVDHLLASHPHAKVTCLDLLNYASDHLTRNLSRALENPNFAFHAINLADAAALEQFFRDPTTTFDAVVHFAAESSVDRSFAAPKFVLDNNVGATVNILECVRKHLAENPDLREKFRFFHISTDEVYGEQNEDDDNGADESAPFRPSNPYLASKAACEHVVLSYAALFGVKTVIIRPNNIYGARQHPEKLVPRCLEALGEASASNGLPEAARIPIHGDGLNTRRYLHVRDLSAALEVVMQHSFKLSDCSNQIYNVGSSTEISNRDMASKVCSEYYLQKWGIPAPLKLVKHISDRNYNDKRYATDCRRMLALGWLPVVSLDEGIRELVQEAISAGKEKEGKYKST